MGFFRDRSWRASPAAPVRLAAIVLAASLVHCADWAVEPNPLITNFFYNDLLNGGQSGGAGSDDIVILSASGGSTAVAEGSATSDSYTISLRDEPTSAVTITLTPDLQISANGSTVPIDLTFTASDYSTPQTVTVLAYDDGAQEGTHSGTIAHTAASSDPAYSGVAVASLVASVSDNDNGTLSGGTVLSVPSFTAMPQVNTLNTGLNQPRGVTTDGAGNLYITDRENHVIRKWVISTSTMSVLAGSVGISGYLDDTGTAARFDRPEGIASDGTYLYVSERANHTIRRVALASGAVTTLAGTAGVSGTSNGTGTAARFNDPRGVTTDGTNVYVGDSGNHAIRQVVIATGVVTTLAGVIGSTGTADGTGSAARFNDPRKLCTDGTYLFVADASNGYLRRVRISDGDVLTLQTGLTFPNAVTTDGTNLYITDDDLIKRYDSINAGGNLTTIAGTTTGFTDGNATTTAQLDSPRGIVNDGNAIYFIGWNNDALRIYD